MRFEPPLGLSAKAWTETDSETETHYECRECGRNLSAEPEECPRCGGEVAEYEW